MSILVVSYSRNDRLQVRAIVALLKSVFPNVDRAILWDELLTPGVVWFDEFKAFIDKTPRLFVFWCSHAAGSFHVRQELEYALHRQKSVVPVLLDDTPLAPELARIHSIDLREAIRHSVPVTELLGPVRTTPGQQPRPERGGLELSKLLKDPERAVAAFRPYLA